ncbi:unnamed protein product [Rhodiola kirilowii]
MEREVEVLSSKLNGELAVSVKKEIRRKAEDDFRWVVVLKLSSGRAFNAPALVAAMKKAWNIKEELSFQELVLNRVVVKLRNEEEQKKAVEGGPWTFMGWAVVVEKWKRGVAPGDYCSTCIRIWVQLHNVPVEYRERAVLGNLAELAGRIIKDENQGSEKTKVSQI